MPGTFKARKYYLRRAQEITKTERGEPKEEDFFSEVYRRTGEFIRDLSLQSA